MTQTASPPESERRPEIAAGRRARVRAVDLTILIGFLGLTVLLGIFPMKVYDIWWHLKTGEIIRQTGDVPRTDWYTYAVPDRTWVDLHWGFQVLASWVYDLGGVVGLNLAKCAVTTLAVGLLVTSRRREWPLWSMVLAWVPALILLGGRMYVRPETLSLLWLAVFLAILMRWERAPRLGLLLPVVQVVWVNTQGLFIFGPFLLGSALLSAAVAPGAFARERRAWWRWALLSAALTGAACLVNPYGLRGALYPITDLLLGTMADPIFKERIAELSSIPKLLEDNAGYAVFMLKLHLFVMTLGALSFLVPIVGGVVRRGSASLELALSEESARGPRGRGASKRQARSERAARNRSPKRTSRPKREPARPLPISQPLFRFLLFLSFSVLSWQATRNSHQFAAVVGTVTAWNFGEWAASLRRRGTALEAESEASGPKAHAPSEPLAPRLATLGVLVVVLGLVGTGTLYAWADEGRTIGLGEEPAYYAHRAVEFAGSSELPPRFVGIHLGNAALFIHRHGPERKVFADARLEVMGADHYRGYMELSQAIARNDPSWSARLSRAGGPDGPPIILFDHAHNAAQGVTLLADSRWRCLWFDPVAAVFWRETDAAEAGLPAVDFLARHFGLEDDPAPPRNAAEWKASAMGINRYVLELLENRQRLDLARSMVPLGLDHARAARRLRPSDPDVWAHAAAMELARVDPFRIQGGSRRARTAFDPTLGLPASKFTFFANQALERDPDQTVALSTLASVLAAQGHLESALPLYERLARRRPRSSRQAAAYEQASEERERIARRLRRAAGVEGAGSGSGPPTAEAVSSLLDAGRTESALAWLEAQSPPETRDWATADLIATLRLQLGEPARARRVWEAVGDPPAPALRMARIAASFYIEDNLERAEAGYQEAVRLDPNLFEAWYGLALTRFELGRPAETLEAALQAIETAPGNAERSAAQALRRMVEPYAPSPADQEGEQEEQAAESRRTSDTAAVGPAHTSGHAVNARSSSTTPGTASSGSSSASYSMTK